MDADKKFGKLTVNWLTVKDLVSQKKYDEAVEIMDNMLMFLGEITLKGVREVDGVSVDLWKDRVWQMIETIGLLPEIDEDIKDFNF